MANPIAVALSGRAVTSTMRGPSSEFIVRGEFASTIQHRFPQPQPINTEMICESIAFEESLLHTDEEIDHSKHVPTRPEDVACLRLSFRRIPALVNLNGLEKLRELRLDNNEIPKVQNLERLTRLTALDLSFNRIQKIEGLDHLPLLKDLTLYGNQISVLEGLDSCTELELLSLGRNRITSLQSIKSLRSFSKLRALSLDANPCCGEDQYRPYIVAFLSQLQYLDYAVITPAEREEARSTGVPLEELKSAEEADASKSEAAAAAALRMDATASLRDAHIEAAETAVEDLLAEAIGWGEIQLLAEAHDPHTKLMERSVELGAALRESGMHRHRQIVRELTQFRQAVDAVVAQGEAVAAKEVVGLRRAIKRATMLAREKDPTSLAQLRAIPGIAGDIESRLTAVEMDTTEKVLGMIDTLESALSELKALKLGAHETFFRAMEIEVKDFAETTTEAVKAAQGRFEHTGSLPDSIPPHGEIAVALQSRDGAETFCKEFSDTLDASIIAMDESARQRLQDLCNRAVAAAKSSERERNRTRLAELAALTSTASEHASQWAAASSLRTSYSRESGAPYSHGAFGGAPSPRM